MRDFFKLKVNWKRVATVVFVVLLVGPYLAALLPCGGAAEQAWLDSVIARVEEIRDTTDDDELRDLLDYTARRYRKIGPFNVNVRSCGPLTAGLNVPYCPGVTIDPWVVNDTIVGVDLGVGVLVHEARHDYFPYWGHYHFDVVDRLEKELLK